LSGEKLTRFIFTLATYSNDRIIKNLDLKKIDSFEKIRTLVITGQQYRDEESMTLFHKLGLNISVTSFQRLTIEQLKANVKYPDEKYDMVLIIDDKDFDGFEAAASIRENNLSGNFIVQLISSKDRKGNFLKSVKMGVDHYLVKPLDKDEFVRALLISFPYIESHNYSNDLTNTKKDINILIVEDNKMNLKVLGTMLTSLGYSFDSAGDGYEGFLKAREKKYDVIFMDLLLPEIDGFESARKILALDKSVLIVAFTADNMPDTKRKAGLSGIKEFIAKPVRIEELKRLFSKYFKVK
jgi:CheY-like chemotaxis protein